MADGGRGGEEEREPRPASTEAWPSDVGHIDDFLEDDPIPHEAVGVVIHERADGEIEVSHLKPGDMLRVDNLDGVETRVFGIDDEDGVMDALKAIAEATGHDEFVNDGAVGGDAPGDPWTQTQRLNTYEHDTGLDP